MAEKELTRLKEEAAANSLREKELAAKEARRAYRKGKREVVDTMKNRFTEFSKEFGELSNMYKSVSDYANVVVPLAGYTLPKSPSILTRRSWLNRPVAWIGKRTWFP